MSSWIEKYSPKNLLEIHTFLNEIQLMLNWFQNIKNDPINTKKVLFIIGPSGIGKTKIAELLFKYHNYRIIEYNSSEIKTQKKITELLEKSLSFKNVMDMFEEGNSPVGFLLDEMDGLLQTGYTTGFNEFINILKMNIKYEDYIQSIKDNNKKKKSKKNNINTNNLFKIENPIICTSCDSNDKKISELKKYSEVIYLNKPSNESLLEIIKFILNNENYIMDISSMYLFIQHIDGDIRKLILSLELLCNNIDINDNYIKEKDIIHFFENNYKDADEPLLISTSKVLYEKKLGIEECEKIFSSDSLLMPLMVYHNSLNSIKNSKEDMNNKLEIYKETLKSICNHDVIQTNIFKNQDWDDDSTTDIASFFSIYLPNYHLTQLTQTKTKIEYTNLLNKISQRLVNNKLLNTATYSFNKLNVDHDEILYPVYILSYYLGDMKKNLITDNDDLNELENKKIKNNNKDDNIEIENKKLSNFMKQYQMNMLDLENILKIEKLNTGNNLKKKKFTTKMKKEIECDLDN